MPEELRGFYMYLRQAFGPFAQGPVALVARHGDECVFAVDALGLRPLWHLETSEAHVFSSEPGVVAVADTIGEPKPLAPGEKLLVAIDRAKGESRLLDHHRLQRLCCERWRERTGGGAHDAGFQRALPVGGPLEGAEIPGYSSAGPAEPVRVESRVLGGFGWQREDMRLVQQMANTGAEPISSLGYDGPLAALSPERQNLADFFKESVAVVTNPAIDREREVEHFSCRAVMGPRPGLHAVPDDVYTVETAFPVILGGHHELAPLSDEAYRKIAREHKTYLLEDLWEEFRGRAKVLDCACLDSESTSGVVERLKHEATGAVRDGARLLVIDDRTAYDGGRRYLDPHLALAAVDLALREHWTASDEPNLRRRCGLVLRSAAIRNVHDVVLALGLGADGVCPYTMIEVALLDDYAAAHRQPRHRAAQGDREGDLHHRHPRGARLRAAVLLDRAQARDHQGLRHRRLRGLAQRRHRLHPARPRRRPAPARAGRRGGLQAGQDLPLLPEGLQGGGGRGGGQRRLRGVLRARARAGARAAGRAAPPARLPVRPRAGAGRGRGPGRGPALLPDLHRADELRLPGRDRLPRLRRGRQAGQHDRHERRGRRAARHVRPLPAVARPAGGGRALRRDRRDAQLVLPGGDQGRPGGQARRGRPPAGQEGDRRGGARPQRVGGHRPHLALQQPRPLLDRGPGRADRRAQDRQPRRPRVGEGAGGAEHRHDRAWASPRRART